MVPVGGLARLLALATWPKRHPAIALGAGVTVVVGLLWALAGDRTALATATPGTSYVVTRGDFDVTIVENGTLKARRSLQVKNELEGKTSMITSVIENGTTVKKGDLLVEFSRTDLEDQLSRAVLDLQTAQNELVQAQEDMKIQESQNKSDLDKAALALTRAEQALEKYESLEGPKALKEAETTIQNRQYDADQARKDRDELADMRQEDLVTEYDYKQAILKAQTTATSLELALLDKELLEKYTHPLTRMERRSARDEAQAELARTKINVEARISQRKANLLKAEAAEASRRQQKEKLEGQLQKTRIHSPADGLVVYGQIGSRYSDEDIEQRIKVGGQVAQNEVLMTLPDLSDMQMVFSVNEADISRVKVGTPARIRVEAFGDLELEGKVETLANLARKGDYWQSRPSSVFDGTLAVMGADPRLRPGITGKIEMLVERVTGVVKVPVTAVFRRGDRHVCFVDDGRGPVEKGVRVGRSSHEFVEIRSGLEEKLRVLLYDPMKGVSG